MGGVASKIEVELKCSENIPNLVRHHLWSHAGSYSTHVVRSRGHSKFASPTHHWSPSTVRVPLKWYAFWGSSFMGCSCSAAHYCIILFKSFCPHSAPTPSFFKPTPDLTTRKRSHFWEVTSMHVPCWVVTFDFLRPFMSRTHQARKLQAHFTLPCAPFQRQWRRWRQWRWRCDI